MLPRRLPLLLAVWRYQPGRRRRQGQAAKRWKTSFERLRSKTSVSQDVRRPVQCRTGEQARIGCRRLSGAAQAKASTKAVKSKSVADAQGAPWWLQESVRRISPTLFIGIVIAAQKPNAIVCNLLNDRRLRIKLIRPLRSRMAAHTRRVSWYAVPAWRFRTHRSL